MAFNARGRQCGGTSRRAIPSSFAARGAPVPASVIVEADASMVASALDRMSLVEAVIKPTVGASGVGVELSAARARS